MRGIIAQLRHQAAVAWIVTFAFTGSLSAASPKVLKATPDNGTVEVDPAIKQIVIIFDQAMSRGSMSIVGGGEAFPKINGQPRWISDRTLTINVQLEPNHDYRLSINNQTFTGFRNARGEPCVPYPIAFKTGAAKNGAKFDPALNKKAVEELHKAVDEEYSYRDLRAVDWDKLFTAYTAKLAGADSPNAFARLAAEMLASAKDVHLFLKVGDSMFGTFKRNVPANANLTTLSRIVPRWKQAGGGTVATGAFDDGIRYVMIGSWSNEAQPALNDVFAAIGGGDPKKGLIIDVRGNSGGSEELAREVAGCFIKQPVVYSRNLIRHNGQWLGPFDRQLEPNVARPSFPATKVVVLQGPYCMSSNESFLLMMKAAGAKLAGETSYGGSGNPKPVELSNGVTVYFPSWKDLRPDDTAFEGQGIAPDISVKMPASDSSKRDPVLDAALKLLRGSS